MSNCRCSTPASAWPGPSQRERALKALDTVGLADRADHKPNQLSGGQQQRVAIARALANQPALLLADEPTGNLDTRTSIDIMGVFQKLNDQGMTIVMVTHELDIAQYTKRMVVMRDGKVVSDTPVAKRLSAETELRRLQEEQKAAQLTSCPWHAMIAAHSSFIIHPSSFPDPCATSSSSKSPSARCAGTRCGRS